MHPIRQFAVAAAILLVLPACAGKREEGGVTFHGAAWSHDYYAEKFDADLGRWYLAFRPETAASFQKGVMEMPESTTLIGVGPDNTTVVVEQWVKGGESNVAKTRRLIETFNRLHDAQVEMPKL